MSFLIKNKLVFIYLAVILGIGFGGHAMQSTNDKASVKGTAITPTASPVPTIKNIFTPDATITPLPTVDTYQQTYQYVTPTDEPNYRPDYSNYYQQPTYSYYQAPTQVPYQEPKNKTCTTVNGYTTCSDGSSMTTSGDYTTINGGSGQKSGSCITNGGYTTCSDGSSGIQNGSYSTYQGNGQSGSCMHNGAFTNCSDGSSTYNSGY